MRMILGGVVTDVLHRGGVSGRHSKAGQRLAPRGEEGLGTRRASGRRDRRGESL